MIRRSAVICIEVVIGLMVALVIMAGIAVWRLSSAPVPLNFLTPLLEQAFNDNSDGQSATVGETLLVWEDWKESVAVHTRNVSVYDAEGERVVRLPEASLNLNLRALLRGTIAPTLVKITGLQLKVIRGEDGSFEFGSSHFDQPESDAAETEAEPVEQEDISVLVPRVLNQLMAQPDPDRPLAFLKAVQVVNARIVVDDRKRQLAWVAPNANIVLRRDKAGLAGEFDLGFGAQGNLANFRAAFVYDKDDKSVDLAASFSDFSFPAMAAVVAELEPVAGLTPKLNGSLTAAMKLDGRVERANVEIQGSAGQLTIAGVLEDPLPLHSFDLRASMDGSSRLLVEAARLSLGTHENPGPVINVTGSVSSASEGFAGDISIEAEASTANIAFDSLGTYWAESLAPGTRSWILENVKSGVAKSLKAQATLFAPDGDMDALKPKSLGGIIEFAGLDIHFLRPLPPVQGVGGVAKFDQSKFVIDANGGTLGDLTAGAAKVVISGLDTADKSKGRYEQMAIDVGVSGPVPNALALLNHERLDLISGLGISPQGSAGQASVDLKFRFPLLKDLKFDHVEISAAGQLQNAAVKDLLLGQDATEGQLSLDLTKEGMRVTGPVKLGGIPLEADWTENFTSEKQQRSQVNAQIPNIDDAGRRLFNLDFGERLVGPVAANVTYTTQRGGSGQVHADIDLQRARFHMPSLLWTKEPGKAGRAKITVMMQDQKVVSYEDIDITIAGFKARGRGRPEADGGPLGALTIDELVFDQSTIAGVHLQKIGERFEISVKGGILDATHFLDPDTPEESDGGGAGESSRTHFLLKAPNLQSMVFGEGRYLQSASLELEQTTQGWRTIHLSGKVPRHLWFSRKADEAEEGASFAERSVSMDFRRNGNGGQTLKARSNDMGAALRALNLRDTINGGNLVLDGSSDGPSPKFPISAHLEVDDFVLVNAPGMARLLTVASFTGLMELMSGDGITFTRMTGDFVLDDGVATTELMRMYGAALGLTARGSINFDEEAVNLEGTVVPAYTFNRILGEIPLLGTLLVGGEGEGFMAVTYNMNGPLDDPKVSVNPLSALAPGFLRGILSGSISGEGVVEAIPRDPGR